MGTARYLRSASMVILDYHMPGIDGQTVLESLRKAASSLGRCPLFYLYTSDDEVARSSKAMGFDGAFRSKGDLAALVTQVEGALRLQALNQMS